MPQLSKNVKTVFQKFRAVYDLINFALVILSLNYPSLNYLLNPVLPFSNREYTLNADMGKPIVDRHSIIANVAEFNRMNLPFSQEDINQSLNHNTTDVVVTAVMRRLPVRYESAMLTSICLGRDDQICTAVSGHVSLATESSDPSKSCLIISARMQLAEPKDAIRNCLVSPLTLIENQQFYNDTAYFAKCDFTPTIRQSSDNELRYAIKLDDRSQVDSDSTSLKYYHVGTYDRGVPGFSKRFVSTTGDVQFHEEGDVTLNYVQAFSSASKTLLMLDYIRVSLFIISCTPMIFVWIGMIQRFWITGKSVHADGLNLLNSSKVILLSTCVQMILIPSNYFDAFYQKWTRHESTGIRRVAVDCGSLYIVLAILLGKLTNTCITVVFEHWIYMAAVYYYSHLLQKNLQAHVVSISSNSFSHWGAIRTLRANESILMVCFVRFLLPILGMAVALIFLSHGIRTRRLLGWKGARIIDKNCSTDVNDRNLTYLELATSLRVENVSGLFVGMDFSAEKLRVVGRERICRVNTVLWFGYCIVDNIVVPIETIPLLRFRQLFRGMFPSSTNVRILCWRYVGNHVVEVDPIYEKLSELERLGLFGVCCLKFNEIGSDAQVKGRRLTLTSSIDSTIVSGFCESSMQMFSSQATFGTNFFSKSSKLVKTDT